jgi:hypothetical protein
VAGFAETDVKTGKGDREKRRRGEGEKRRWGEKVHKKIAGFEFLSMASDFPNRVF